jgi:hypothetical protein
MAEVESTQCEDYPCCGHGPPPLGDGGGCPVRYSDGTQRFKCCGCSTLLPAGASSALCDGCQRRACSDFPDEFEAEEYHDGWQF